MTYRLKELFEIKGQVAVITGGGGVLCSEMSVALGQLGVKVAVLDLRPEAAEEAAQRVNRAGGKAMAVECNVLERPSLEQARDAVLGKFKKIDVLINGAGGNHPKATSGLEHLVPAELARKSGLAASFFGLEPAGVRFVFDLNFLGTLLPTQVFAESMARRKQGQVINISSMAAFRPLTKVPAYSAAKAAVSNFTQWLAVHLGPVGVRVNAIAPGFFLTEQNRFLLVDQKTGKTTARGQKVLAHTPQGRYGQPADLIGCLVWLMSPSASFVTGTVIPVDGGFAAYSGV